MIDEAFEVLSRPLGADLNAAFECCDRWCGDGRVALRWEDQYGREETRTFEDLRSDSSRLANLLAEKGIQAGDRVAGLLPRTPYLLTVILAVWRLGAIYLPLFTAFGPKAIEHRLNKAEIKVVITDAVYVSRFEEVKSAAQVYTITPVLGFVDISTGVLQQPDYRDPVFVAAESPFLVMFTSGTTGPAKSLLVPLRAIVAMVGYMRDAVGLRAEDRFWNIADPGWAYGLYYGIVGPLAMGQATLLYDGPFAVESMVRILHKYRITNLAGSPTAFRLVMGTGPEAVAPISGQLRAVSSAGEPLNPEVIRWFAEHLRVPIYDHYGQTELGMVICNHHGLHHLVQVGTAGHAMPGHRVVILNDDDVELGPGEPGILAVDIRGSPLFWFGGYEGIPQAPDPRYYRTGDTMELNEDGSISFVGRADDVITSSGYRIGPFDVESALIEHEAVLEAAVVGVPDEERTEIVKAFVTLAPGHSPSDVLADLLKKHLRGRLSAHAYPRELVFVDQLPKTPSGKIQRFLLRRQA